MQRSKIASKFLNELVTDCITFGLKEPEALEYIKVRFQEIKSRSYQYRKARLLSEGVTQVWLNHFTRIGYVSNHKNQLESIQKLHEDSMRQLMEETTKENRNEDKILKLKQDIRDNVKLLSELGLGTPIISAIKSKMQQQEQDVKTVQNR